MKNPIHSEQLLGIIHFDMLSNKEVNGEIGGTRRTYSQNESSEWKLMQKIQIIVYFRKEGGKFLEQLR